MECLNNCSYPNGICNQEKGSCSCNTLYNPYNRTQRWSSWKGTDCSFLPAWSASHYVPGISFALIIALLGSFAVVIT